MTGNVPMRLCGMLALLVCASGCGGAAPPATTPATSNPNAAPVAVATTPTTPAVPKIDWKVRVESLKTALAAADFDAVTTGLDNLRQSSEPLPAEIETELGKLEAELRTQQLALQARQRTEKLALAKQQLEAGDLEGSQRAVDEVLTIGPTGDERTLAANLKRDIEDRRRARRKLVTAMDFLKSSDARQVRSGQQQLREDPTNAIPMLGEAAQSADPVLVSNALETLRLFNRPEKALPVILGVLRSSHQAASWPAASRELRRLGAPGAGPALLELSVSAGDPGQRTIALETLAQVVDPPPDTLVKLLPVLLEDRPELPAALTAAGQAALKHEIYDLVGRKGFATVPSPEQDRQLTALAKRLETLAALPVDDTPRAGVRQGAWQLGLALHLLPPQVLPGVKLSNVSEELPEGPGPALLDGQWQAIDPKTMWRSSAERLPSVVLDLGQERTVSAVRIWNFNEPGGQHRGWKEVEIFVSDNPAPLTAQTRGTILPAPGIADPVDYGITLPVPLARGRYVKLRALSLWRPDVYCGLSEIQVFGF